MNYKISEKVYTKIIFHAAKYPHLALNGILLGERAPKSSQLHIVDAIPLFHQCLYVTPMTEIALVQIDAFAESENLTIAGCYYAPENFHDNSIEKPSILKLADKILENNKNACLLTVDNTLVTLEHTKPAIKVYSKGDGQRWVKSDFSLAQSKITLEAVSALLKRGAMKDIVDFDNHLDNPEKDWTNKFLNNNLNQLLAMY